MAVIALQVTFPRIGTREDVGTYSDWKMATRTHNPKDKAKKNGK